jgi:lysyl-tRNA synthetase class 2
MTHAERRLWQRIRLRQLEGYKFRRQFPIDRFIADFCCVEAGLIVEIDGGQHNEAEAKDEARTKVLAENGYQVLRFWNNQVLQETDSVLEAILLELRKRPHPDPPPQAGEGTELESL